MHDPREEHGAMSRREFLRMSAGAAVALPSAAAILAACTKPGQGSSGFELSRSDHPVTLPMNGQPIPTDTPLEQNAELLLYNWQDYI